jgi:hypothetical protein
VVEIAQQDPIRRHLAAEAEHDARSAAATYAPDSTYENAALGITFEGREAIEFQYAASYDLIRDLTAEYLWTYEGEDFCVQFGRLTGRVQGDLLGVPAKGGDLDVPFVAVNRFRGAEMLAEHVYYELDAFCQQAGLDVSAVRDAVAGSGL